MLLHILVCKQNGINQRTSNAGTMVGTAAHTSELCDEFCDVRILCLVYNV